MKEVMETVYFHNTVEDYLITLAIITGGLLLIKIFKQTLLQRIKAWADKTETGLDDFVVRGIERFGIPALYYSAIYFGLNYLTLSTRVYKVLQIATTILITFLILRLISSTILLILQSYIRKQEGGQEKVKQLGGLMMVISVIIWIIGLIFLFDNMGYNVTAVITGLGIGGIAVALAAQNILGDLFNYFVIFFDKPFEIGDVIAVDTKTGTVDYIGIKTTRIKSTSGEQLIFSNSDLTTSRIHNYKRMERRRAVFTIKVVYGTSVENLRKIPQVLKSIVEQQEPVLFERAHFVSYGESSLNFEVVYFVLNSDYNKYMNIQQNINLQILEEFKKSAIEFAFTPTPAPKPNV